MTFKLDNRGEKLLATVKPNLQKVARKAIELSPLPFTIVQGARTQAYQDWLYSQGRTRPGKIVTWTRSSSKHIGGNAIDFALLDSSGNIDWNEANYPKVAKAFYDASGETGVGIVSGQEWKTKDWGHIQLDPARDRPPAPQYTIIMATADPQKAVEAPKEQMVNDPAPHDLSRPEGQVAFLEDLGWQKHQAAAIVGQGIWESGGKDHINTSALGDKGSAHGGWQWRGERYIGTKGLLSFTFTQCPGLSSTEPEVQLRFVNWELTEGSERRAGNLLKAATNVEEATKAFIGYLRPVNFTWDNPELGHGYAQRLRLAKSLL